MPESTGAKGGPREKSADFYILGIFTACVILALMIKALGVGEFLIIVDDLDITEVLRHRWYIDVDKRSTVPHYRARTEISGKGIYLHNLIFEADPGFLLDHRNGNGLDNRSLNLRQATVEQNMQNSRKHKVTDTSPYKGVYHYDYSGEGWMCKIRIDGRQTLLGRFTDPIEAACAYDDAARKHFGRYANVNFPLPDEVVPAPVLFPEDIFYQEAVKTVSGVRGVTWDPGSKRKPWRAQIAVGGKTKRLGRFASVEEAERAYLSARGKT